MARGLFTKNTVPRGTEKKGAFDFWLCYVATEGCLENARKRLGKAQIQSLLDVHIGCFKRRNINLGKET